MSDPRQPAIDATVVPDVISQHAARQLFAALNYLVAVIRTPDDPVQSGALQAADDALEMARQSQ